MATEGRELIAQIRSILGHDFLGESGGVFGSPLRTLKEGDFYLVGLNPGQAGMSECQIKKWTINSNLLKLEDDSMKHNITQESYPKSDRKYYPVGEAPFQLSARSFFNSIDVDLNEVCYSNLYFVRTPGEKELLELIKESDWREKCLRTHEAIMKVVKPKTIIFFSSTAYYEFKSMFAKNLDNENKMIINRHAVASGHKGKEIKLRKFRLHDTRIYNVIWLPHLSWYKFNTLPSLARERIGIEIKNYIKN